MRSLPSLTGFSRADIGVDPGADTTVLCARGGELVIAEPSVIAIDAHSGCGLAAGSEALELLGSPGVAASWPVTDGTIVDLQRTAELLHHLIGKAEHDRRSRLRVVASVSIGMSALHRRAMTDACLAAGAREARLIARPIAAALGCGLPVHEPIGSMIVDLGATMSEVAMISMCAIVASQPIRVGRHDFDQRIVAHLRRTHQLLIGPHAVEHINVEIGSLRPDMDDTHIDIVGRDLPSGTLTSVRLTGHEVRNLLEPSITRIVDAAKNTLARTPPQLAADIIERGITLTGNNSLLRGIAQRIRHDTGMPAHVAHWARTCTAIGAAKSLEQQPTHARRSARRAIRLTAAASH
jgi:rod shape-determining protein MreB